MGLDEDFYELATRFPEVALTLAGIEAKGPYTAEAVEVKRSRRGDLLLRPQEDGDGPRVYLELQAYVDPGIERRFLEEVVMHCVKDGRFSDVRAVVFYTELRYRTAALSADVCDGDRVLVRFEPTRVVLEQLSFDAFERMGGAALALLPLVGPRAGVEEGARRWHRALKTDPGLEMPQRQDSLELFLRLLADRLGTMDVEALLGEGEHVVEHTVTGQRLIERGLERGLKQGLEQGIERGRDEARRLDVLKILDARFGPPPGHVVDRVNASAAQELERLLIRAATAPSLEAFAADLPLET